MKINNRVISRSDLFRLFTTFIAVAALLFLLILLRINAHSSQVVTRRPVNISKATSTNSPTVQKTTPVVTPSKNSQKISPKVTKPPTLVKRPVIHSAVTPVVVPSPSSKVSGLKPIVTPPPATTSTTAPAGSSTSPSTSTSTPLPSQVTAYTSTNWSGYMATTSKYSGITGSWNVPKATGNGTSTSADVSWVGIGGVTSADLIQVGTENIISANGQVTTAGFYEILPAPAIPISTMPVKAGDNVTASLKETSPGQWLIKIINNSTGGSFTINISYTSTNSSAEWIQEDPSYSHYSLIPLDTFVITSFTNGLTQTLAGDINIEAAKSDGITLVNSSGKPLATPTSINGDGASFSVVQN